MWACKYLLWGQRVMYFVALYNSHEDVRMQDVTSSESCSVGKESWSTCDLYHMNLWLLCILSQSLLTSC